MTEHDDSQCPVHPALVFVYNADSGLFNALTDSAHKLLSPDTYECNLCAITYSALGMKREWKEFIEGLEVPVEFLHRDELKKTHGISDIDLPAVFFRRSDQLEAAIGAEEINACNDIAGLRGLVEARLGR